jgi:uncharacterized protein YndB with AHSA1/START domain
MLETKYQDNKINHTIKVERIFSANLDRVWQAWTDSRELDKWWAPKPWFTITQKQDFKEGGSWLYYMKGPGGEKSWCVVEYLTINSKISFSGNVAFCDKSGVVNTQMPHMNWLVEFESINNSTKVMVTITFEDAATMKKTIDMGFKQGFAMAHNNLDELLK